VSGALLIAGLALLLFGGSLSRNPDARRNASHGSAAVAHETDVEKWLLHFKPSATGSLFGSDAHPKFQSPDARFSRQRGHK
jgi:hypothetical protein